jgi:cell wall-associated NlpC family hydrolase
MKPIRIFKSKIFKAAAAAVCALTVSMACSGALAAGSVTGYVTSSGNLNIRSSASSAAAIVGKAPYGAALSVIRSGSGWYEINYGGVSGWVSGHYLRLDATVKVNGSLNVRQSASASSAAVGRLYNGQLVTVTDASAGWFRVSYRDGSGWINGGYLTLGNDYLSGSAKVIAVTDAAQRMIGTPYLYGGASAAGIDCSGLTKYAFAKAGVTLPHSASQQAALGTAVARADLRPGDLVFFDTSGGHSTVTHVGIYLGGGKFVSAQSGSSPRVTLASLSNSYWSARYLSARRIVS